MSARGIVYYLWANDFMVDKDLEFEAYPDLKGKFIAFNNNICPSQYDSSIKCFWEGDLSVTLILNGKEIKVNDHDSRKGTISIVNNYVIQGESVVIQNKSCDDTYLKFKISKH